MPRLLVAQDITDAKMSEVGLEVLNKEARTEARLHKAAKRCARKHGRGAFVVTFSSPEALVKGNADDMYCQFSVFGGKVGYIPVACIPTEAMSDKTKTVLREYDIKTSACLYIELSTSNKAIRTSADNDVRMAVSSIVFDVPRANSSKCWKNLMRELVAEQGRMPGEIQEIVQDIHTPEPHPLTADILQMLAPSNLLVPHPPRSVDTENEEDHPRFLSWQAGREDYLTTIAKPIDDFLWREVSSIADQTKYRVLVEACDRQALLREGLVRDVPIMQALVAQWRKFGGAVAFFAILDKERKAEDKRQQALDVGLLHVCANCGDERPTKKKLCSRCGIARYCDARCQLQHWEKHKVECQKVMQGGNVESVCI